MDGGGGGGRVWQMGWGMFWGHPVSPGGDASFPSILVECAVCPEVLIQSPSRGWLRDVKEKWQELQFVCDNDRHQVQLVTDETFPLKDQESSGQAWKVLADKVAWPPKILQKPVGRTGEGSSAS